MPEQERLSLSIAEASDQIGISEQTIRRLIKTGDFPHVRMGNSVNSRIVIPVAALKQWLNERAA